MPAEGDYSFRQSTAPDPIGLDPPIPFCPSGGNCCAISVTRVGHSSRGRQSAFAVIAHGYVRATADIDLVARQDRDYDELRARAVEATAAGVAIRVAGLDDLIRMKRASGRPQDLRDIANLSQPLADR